MVAVRGLAWWAWAAGGWGGRGWWRSSRRWRGVGCMVVGFLTRFMKNFCIITPVFIATCKKLSKNSKIPSDKIGLFVIKYIEKKILLC